VKVGVVTVGHIAAGRNTANHLVAAAFRGDQVRLVEHAVAVLGWDLLDEALRDVALARLANPSASLAELGQLCDPPVGKSAVHRRLARLRVLVDEATSDD
jgi:DNA-binding transcriptional regulator WhiA